jgi:uncharacterized DUF497 family protein
MEFDWDPSKEASNRAKHGIRFDEAVTVFDDPFAIIENATRGVQRTALEDHRQSWTGGDHGGLHQTRRARANHIGAKGEQR